MNIEYQDIIEYLEYKCNGYKKQIELTDSCRLKEVNQTKVDAIKELISDIKNGEHLDF